MVEIFGPCEHLNNPYDSPYLCKKRYFKIFDYIKDSIYHIGICNDYLKLEFQKQYAENDKYSRIEDILWPIVSEHTGIRRIEYWGQVKRNKKPINPVITFVVCERPFMYTQIQFLEAIKIYANSDNYYIRERLHERIQSGFNRVHSYMSQYFKYKSDHKQLTRIKKKFKNVRYCDTEAVELMGTLLNLITKYY